MSLCEVLAMSLKPDIQTDSAATPRTNGADAGPQERHINTIEPKITKLRTATHETDLHIADDGGVAELDRRGVPRRGCRGTAMAVFNGNGTVAALVRINLIDESLGGLGVLSPVPVECGSQFSLVPEAGIGLKQIGYVVGCIYTPEGYRLGLKNRTLRAVA